MSAVAPPTTIPVIINHPRTVDACLRAMDAKIQNTCLLDAAKQASEHGAKAAEESAGYGTMSPVKQALVKEAGITEAQSAMLTEPDPELRGEITYTRMFKEVDLDGTPAMEIREVTLFGPNQGIYSRAEELKSAVDTALADFRTTLEGTNHFINATTRVRGKDEPWGEGGILSAPFGHGDGNPVHNMRTSRVTINFTDYISVMATTTPKDLKA